MKLLTALALALMLPACATSFAGEGREGKDGEWYPNSPTGIKEYGRKGPYASVGGVLSKENFDTSGTGLSAGDSDLGFAFRVGARLEKNVAVELTAEDITGYTLKGFGSSVDLDLWSIGVQGKYFFSDEKVQPYALVGLGVAHADVDTFDLDDSGSYFRVGGGADIYINKDIAVFGELSYNRMMGDLKDLDHIDFIVGLLVRF
jgi:hypothetical protein